MVRASAISALIILTGCPGGPVIPLTDTGQSEQPDAGGLPGDAGTLDVASQGFDAGVSDAGASDASANCTTNAECAEAERCIAGRCRRITEEATCTNDDDCGNQRTCSSLGLCFAGECLTHGDCPTEKRCFEDRCTPRPDPADGIFFERRRPAVIDQHHGSLPFPNQIGYGWGGGLFDLDADGDLDLFLGTRYRFHEHE